jgi:hypothetical protein
MTGEVKPEDDRVWALFAARSNIIRLLIPVNAV